MQPIKIIKPDRSTSLTNDLPLVILLITQLFFGLHILVRDDLLFSSPPVTVAIYAGSLILGLTCLIFPLAWLLHKVGGPSIPAWVGPLGATGAIALVLLVGFQWLAPQLGLVNRILLPERNLYIGLASILVISTLLVRHHPEPAALTDRATTLGRLLAVLWIATAMGGAVMAHLPHHEVLPGNRHTLLILVDGVPTKYLNTYNPDATPTALDSVLRQGIVYTGMHTIHPWTNGWFGTFYSGRSDLSTTPDTAVGNGPNLLSTLEAAGVRTRWIASHTNAIPEGSAAHASNYRGLRSLLLGSGWHAIPAFLGVDYHFTYRNKNPNIGVMLNSPLRRKLYTWMNGTAPDYPNQFLDVLLPELRQQVAAGGESFTMFYTQFVNFGKREFRTFSNRYDPQEPDAVAVVDHLAATITPQLDAVGERLAALLQTIATDPQLRGVRVIITSDHGSGFEKGRIWYGYHPTEEVLRTACAIVDGSHTGINEQWFTTSDLTTTIMELHGVINPLDLESTSLMSATGRDWLAALTLESSTSREWYLVLYSGITRLKYWFNLFPRNTGHWSARQLRGYHELEVASGTTPPPEVVPELRTALANFAIQPKLLHARYQELISPTALPPR